MQQNLEFLCTKHVKKLFEDIRILDFTNNAAGPVCTSMFASFGADVIKVERPVTGDDIRGFAPRLDGQALNFLFYNRGKRSITVDLTDPAGVEMVKRIVPTADVIVESFRPGVMKKFGLDYASILELNPQVVYCSVSAFGQTGPWAGKPGYDLIAQALCGVMDMTGEPDEPPQKSGFILGDYVGAMNAFGAISAALYYKSVTGIGQYIDVALLDGMVAMNNFVELAAIGVDQHRIGAHHSAICPYGVYNGKNGQAVAICAPNNKLWSKVCTVMGQPELTEDPRFCSGEARIRNLKEVISVIEGWLKRFDNINDAISLLDRAGIPVAKVQSAMDLLTDEQLLARAMIVDMEMPPNMPTYKHIKSRGMWLKFSKTPAEIRRAPELGEHNREVLPEFGYTVEEIDALQNKWWNRH